MKKNSERLVVIAALAAMIALVFAVPVHHAHMLQAAFAGSAEAAGQAAQHVHSGHEAHHHAEHHARHASALPAQYPPPEGDNSGHDMPRCPVCSMVQSAAAPVPSWGPAFVSTNGQAPAPAIVASATIPSSFHFLPVQPRAPPIAG